MDLTPQDLWTLRNIVIRAVNEAHEVLAEAARRNRREASSPGRGAFSDKVKPQAPRAPIAGSSASPEKLTYTLKEACQALGLSKSTLYKLIGDERIRTLRVGGRRLIEREALVAFLRAARSGDD